MLLLLIPLAFDGGVDLGVLGVVDGGLGPARACAAVLCLKI